VPISRQMPPVDLNLTNVPFPQPGTWGICPGVGPIAAIIRHATASWAGHAVMYVGNGAIVQATWPRVKLSPVPVNNVIWATGQTLTAEQRIKIVARAKSLVGDGYDWLIYPFLLADVFDAAITRDVSRLFKNDKWLDCSGLIEDCDAIAGAAMFPGGSGSEHFVTPAMLMNLGVQEGWFRGQ
jgi:hypothetical protein